MKKRIALTKRVSIGDDCLMHSKRKISNKQNYFENSKFEIEVKIISIFVLYSEKSTSINGFRIALTINVRASLQYKCAMVVRQVKKKEFT